MIKLVKLSVDLSVKSTEFKKNQSHRPPLAEEIFYKKIVQIQTKIYLCYECQYILLTLFKASINKLYISSVELIDFLLKVLLYD